MSEDKQSFQAEGIMEKGYGFIPKLIMKDKELTIEAKAIYAYLSSYTGAGNITYPSISLMCGDLDISEARFYKHRKLLIEKGYIVIEKKRNEGGWSNNVYRLPFKPYPQNLCTQNLSIQNLCTQNEGTKSNSLKSNSLKSNNNTKNIYSAFEKAWKEYPTKKGKKAVNKKNKEVIEKLGEEKILQAVRNYTKDIAHQRANGFKDLNYMNGSTFFNGRYEDYLDESSITPLKQGAYVQDTTDWDGFDLGMRV